MCGRSFLSGQDVELAWGGGVLRPSMGDHATTCTWTDGLLAECWHVCFRDPPPVERVRTSECCLRQAAEQIWGCVAAGSADPTRPDRVSLISGSADTRWQDRLQRSQMNGGKKCDGVQGNGGCALKGEAERGKRNVGRILESLLIVRGAKLLDDVPISMMSFTPIPVSSSLTQLATSRRALPISLALLRVSSC